MKIINIIKVHRYEYRKIFLIDLNYLLNKIKEVIKKLFKQIRYNRFQIYSKIGYNWHESKNEICVLIGFEKKQIKQLEKLFSNYKIIFIYKGIPLYIIKIFLNFHKINKNIFVYKSFFEKNCQNLDFLWDFADTVYLSNPGPFQVAKSSSPVPYYGLENCYIKNSHYENYNQKLENFNFSKCEFYNYAPLLIKLYKNLELTLLGGNTLNVHVSSKQDITSVLVIDDFVDKRNSFYEHFSLLEKIIVDVKKKFNNNVQIFFYCNSRLYTDDKFKIDNLILIDATCSFFTIIEQVSEVVVFTSILGLDALIYNKELYCYRNDTYLGFLIDNSRKVIFCEETLNRNFIYYFLYHFSYLEKRENRLSSALSVMFRHSYYKRRLFYGKLNKLIDKKHINYLIKSKYWGILFSNKFLKSNICSENFVDLFDFNYFINNSDSKYYKLFVATVFFSIFCKKTEVGRKYFYKVIDFFEIKMIGEIIEILISAYDDHHFVKLLQMINKNCKKQALFQIVDEIDFDFFYSRNMNLYSFNAKKYIQTASTFLKSDKKEVGFKIYFMLFSRGIISSEIVFEIIQLLSKSFKFESAIKLLFFLSSYNFNYKNAAVLNEFAKNIAYLYDNSFSVLKYYAYSVIVDPRKTAQFSLFSKGFSDEILQLPIQDALLYDDYPNKILLSEAYNMCSNGLKAELILKKVKPNHQNYLVYFYTLAKSLFLQERIFESIKLLESVYDCSPNSTIYNLLLSYYNRVGNTKDAKVLLEKAGSKKVKILNANLIGYYQNILDFKKSFSLHSSFETQVVLSKTLKNKFLAANKIFDIPEKSSILIVAFQGPAEELRYMGYCNKLVERFPNQNLAFMCDSRIYQLFSDNYPDLQIFPNRRRQWLYGLENLYDYDQLPHLGLHLFFDNIGYNTVLNFDYFIFLTDIMMWLVDEIDFVEDRHIFSIRRSVVESWRKQLETYKNQGKFIIGLAWRSSLVDPIRLKGYFSIMDFSSIFELDNVVCVNLVSNDISKEKEWVDKFFPNKFIDFERLDKYNDFIGTGGLIMNLDLVIGCPTTNAEFADCLGCPTITLSKAMDNVIFRHQKDSSKNRWYSEDITIYIEDEIQLHNELVQLVKSIIEKNR